MGNRLFRWVSNDGKRLEESSGVKGKNDHLTYVNSSPSIGFRGMVVNDPSPGCTTRYGKERISSWMTVASVDETRFQD